MSQQTIIGTLNRLMANHHEGVPAAHRTGFKGRRTSLVRRMILTRLPGKQHELRDKQT